MFSAKKVRSVFAVFAASLAFSAFAAPMEKALIVDEERPAKNYASMLRKDFVCTCITKDNGEKESRKRGYVLPKYEELKQYKFIVLGNFTSTLDENKQDIIDFVKNGGTVYASYLSLQNTCSKAQEKVVGYGICGFKKLRSVHLTPYPKAGPMEHDLVYTKEMGTEKEFKCKLLYTNYAGELTDAVPLVINREKEGLALVCVAKYGKGQFIFNGAPALPGGVLMDVLKKCGICK